MFTLKFYSTCENRCRIKMADDITIMRGFDGSDAEITLHYRDGNRDHRIDIAHQDVARPEGWPPAYQKVIIENAAGKTTEIISCGNVAA